MIFAEAVCIVGGNRETEKRFLRTSFFFFFTTCLSLCFFRSPFLDIDECKTNSHDCNANAYCNNTKGSYHCFCKPGYIGNGRSCTGKVETFWDLWVLIGLGTEILKKWPKKLFWNRLCSKNVVWPWKPNKIRIFVSSPIIGSNWKDIYLFIYLPFHLFVYFIIDYVVFFSDCFFWYRASDNTESRLLLLDQSVCFYSVFSVVNSKQKQYQQPIVAREVSWGTNENSKQK